MSVGKPPVSANPVKKIKSEAELDRALRRFCDLVGDPAQSTYLDALIDEIEKYEDTHHPIPEPSHAELVKHLLPTKRGGIAQLARAVGLTVRDIRAILDGRRQISPDESAAFARFFSVDQSVFDPQPDEIQVVFRDGLIGRHLYGFFRWTTQSDTKATSGRTPTSTFSAAAFIPMPPTPGTRHVGSRYLKACW